ncbi:CRISPR-associated protein [Campylobacterota bacterium]|nr:CRISPR-associated protein [Campylobacterota bacterium]
MAKVLISLLGTGTSAKGDTNRNRYETTDYAVDGKIYESELFVAGASAKHYAIDKLFLIGTSGSMWDEVAAFFNADNETLALLDKKANNKLIQDDISQLNRYIDKELGISGSKCLFVPDGENDSEVWQTFEVLRSLIDTFTTDDELYFDITHGFRSQSLLMFVIAQFGQTYKNYKIGGILYGKLIKNELSPIIDLKMYYEFLEWSKAIKNLRNYGNGNDLKKLLENSNEDKTIKKTIADFANALSIADMDSMQKSMRRLKSSMELLRGSKSLIIKDILSNELLDFVRQFNSDGTRSEFLFELADWYKKCSNFAMAYIALAEAAMSRVIEKNNLSADKNGHELAKEKILKLGEIANAFKEVNEIRNDIAHQLVSSAHAVSKCIDDFDDHYKILKKIYEV